MPDTTRTIALPEMNALANDASRLTTAESHLRETRQLTTKHLVSAIGHEQCMRVVHLYEESFGRLLFGKAISKASFPHAITGKLSIEKAELLRGKWVEYLQEAYAVLSAMGTELGITMPAKTGGALAHTSEAQ